MKKFGFGMMRLPKRSINSEDVDMEQLCVIVSCWRISRRLL